MSPMRKILPLATLALLAGCAYPTPERVNSLNALVGKTDTDLVRALGVPTKTYATGGHQFLSFSHSRIESYPGFGPGYGFGYGYGWGPRWGWGGYYGTDIVQTDCDITFELTNGIAQSWTLRGSGC